MKAWLFHFSLKRKLKKLQKPLDPGFVAKLGLRLEKEASHLLIQETPPLAFKFPLMKRRFLVYANISIILMLILSINFKFGTISTEEIIQNASASYEEAKDSGKIYHELTLVERYEDGKLVNSSLDEFWINQWSNEYLFTSKNPGTGNLILASGTSKDNDTYWYTTHQETMDILKEEAENPWSQSFKGPKYFCKISDEQYGTVVNSILQIAEEDPSVYVVNGNSYAKTEASDLSSSYIEQTSSLRQIEGILNYLANTDEEVVDYETVEEEGKTYYVFKIELDDENYVKEFFQTTDFRHSKTQYFSSKDSNQYDEITYLNIEYLEAEEGESIFDFAQYGMLVTADINSTLGDFAKEDACYNSEQELMSEEAKEALLSTLDPLSILQWENLLSGIMNSSIEKGANENDDLRLTIEHLTETIEVQIEENENNSAIPFISPVKEGIITQGFTTAHPGINFTHEDGGNPMPNIYAVADGTVISVHEGWNGGYGKTILIDHGNGYISRYAHLSNFYVENGQIIKQGDKIGTMGNSGRVYGKTGIHLHFELRYNTIAVNPLDYFDPL